MVKDAYDVVLIITSPPPNGLHDRTFSNYLYFQVGMFVVYVKRLPTICAILVHIRCAKDVQKMLISSVFEEAKAFAQHA